MTSSTTDANTSAQWISIQEQLSQQRVDHDELDFTKTWTTEGRVEFKNLHLVGGLDVSFFEGEENQNAIACVVVVKYVRTRTFVEATKFVGIHSARS